MSRTKEELLFLGLKIDPQDEYLLDKIPWYYDKKHRELTSKVGPNREECVRLSRLIMGAPSHLVVDHINHDKMDNRRCNLRLATRLQNNQNMAKSKANQSGYKGVCLHKPSGKWLACIKVNGVRRYLGYFTDKLEAAKAYDEAARLYFGEFAQTNV